MRHFFSKPSFSKPLVSKIFVSKIFFCGAATAIAVLATTSFAHADDSGPDYERLIGKPHTIAVLQAGIIALPEAPISASQQGGNTILFGPIGKGDATVETGVNVIFRLHRRWAFGAGFQFGPKPTADTQYGGNAALPRTHSRSYLFWGVEGRWFPLRYKWLEGWVGLSAGEVVIADRFDTDVGDPEPAILGTREVTVRSEGFATGLQLGADWLLSDHFVFGVIGRGSLWVLPSELAFTPIGDRATLSGAVFAVEIGLTIGYRIPL